MTASAKGYPSLPWFLIHPQKPSCCNAILSGANAASDSHSKNSRNLKVNQKKHAAGQFGLVIDFYQKQIMAAVKQHNRLFLTKKGGSR